MLCSQKQNMNFSALLRFLAISVPALLASCAKPAYEVRGYASYIADQYAGQYTTSGSIYQPQGWTAAHNTLPFGTVVNHDDGVKGSQDRTRPFGVSFVGAHCDDPTLVGIAYAFEQATRRRVPPPHTP